MTQIIEGFSLSHAQILDGTTKFLSALGAAALESEDIYGVNEASLDPDTGDYDNEGDDSILSTWSWFNFADISVQAGYISFPLWANLTSRPIDTEGGSSAVDEVQEMTATGATAGTFTLSFRGQETAGLQFDASAQNVQDALAALSTVGQGDITVTGTTADAGALTFTFGDAMSGSAQPPIEPNLTGLTGVTGGGGVVTTTTEGSPAVGESMATDLWHEDSMNVPPRPMVTKMPAKDSDGAVRQLAIGLYRVQFKPITFEGPAYKDGLKVNYNGRAVFSTKDETGAAFPDGKKRVGRVLSFA